MSVREIHKKEGNKEGKKEWKKERRKKEKVNGRQVTRDEKDNERYLSMQCCSPLWVWRGEQGSRTPRLS